MYTLAAFIGMKRKGSSEGLLIHFDNSYAAFRTTSVKAGNCAVCWSGACRCVLTKCKCGTTSVVTLEKQFSLPNKLGRLKSTELKNLVFVYVKTDYKATSLHC
ncbi:hypothetical protein ILYODFUR_012033 [Ilyodon furcidens]|uniref:Uncharacterized protein n=1 Tax=Ilyodon furcidens TaxID=33524 RepID=A0ABV0SKJ2_9TELE